VSFLFLLSLVTDFEEAQQQQQLAKGNGNNNGNPHWQEQFAQWNLNN